MIFIGLIFEFFCLLEQTNTFLRLKNIPDKHLPRELLQLQAFSYMEQQPDQNKNPYFLATPWVGNLFLPLRSTTSVPRECKLSFLLFSTAAGRATKSISMCCVCRENERNSSWWIDWFPSSMKRAISENRNCSAARINKDSHPQNTIAILNSWASVTSHTLCNIRIILFEIDASQKPHANLIY